MPVPPELLERILALADNGMILIGGQALAFWAAYYDAPAPVIAVTKDVDFIGTRRTWSAWRAGWTPERCCHAR